MRHKLDGEIEDKVSFTRKVQPGKWIRDTMDMRMSTDMPSAMDANDL